MVTVVPLAVRLVGWTALGVSKVLRVSTAGAVRVRARIPVGVRPVTFSEIWAGRLGSRFTMETLSLPSLARDAEACRDGIVVLPSRYSGAVSSTGRWVAPWWTLYISKTW